LNLKAKFETGSSCSSFKRLVPGAFKVDFIASTCTGLPWAVCWRARGGTSGGTAGRGVAAQVDFESKS
jgi:hypothetical protein